MADEIKQDNLNNCNNNGEDRMKGFPYPACWKDEARMKVLLATFFSRELDPDSYDSKMKFWEETILQYCLYFGKANFCRRELQLQFARGERIPACLDTVILSMQHTKKLRLRAEYEYDPENTWSGWAMNSFIKKPLSWGWQKVKNTVIAEDINKESSMEWILLPAIRKFCTDVEAKVLNVHRGKLLHFDAFKSLCLVTIKLADETLLLVLHTLNCQRKIGLEYKQDSGKRTIHLVKIPKSDNDIDITESDRAIHNLQMTRENLLKQIEDLEDEIKINEDKARQYLSEKKRQLAKTYLRKKQLLEKNHEKRSLALHNIEALLSNVDEAQHNGVVLDAYKIGSKALQNALNESGLKYDNVDEVLADVRDTIEQHKEVQDTISNANLVDSTLNNISDDEIERELRELMGESNNATNKSVSVENKSTVNNKQAEAQQIVITDEELLEMLDGLEVEDSTIPNANITQSTIEN